MTDIEMRRKTLEEVKGKLEEFMTESIKENSDCYDEWSEAGTYSKIKKWIEKEVEKE